MKKINFKNGYYGTDKETYLVVDGNVFAMTSVGFNETSINVLDKCKYLGQDLSKDYEPIMIYQSLIDKELERLNVSTDDDPYSGISTDLMEVGDNIKEEDVEDLDHLNFPLKVYDDHASEWVDAEKFYSTLKNLESACLDHDSPNNIWNYIS